MEEKAIYISQEEIHSTKKNKDYYVVHLVLNRKPFDAFVTKEVYDKIAIKKLKDLQEVTACFNTNIIGSNVQATLFDIK